MIRSYRMLFCVVMVFTLAEAALSQYRPAEPRVVPVPYRPILSTPVYLANGTQLMNIHEVLGRVTGASPVTVTLSGSARFTNSASYFCVATGADEVQMLGPQVVNVDGAHFQIVHAAAQAATITYRCAGM